MVISSIFCHYITGDRGGRTKHDKDCHQFLIPVADINGRGKKKCGQEYQLDKRSQERRLYFFYGILSLKSRPDGDQSQRSGGGSDTADSFFQECWEPEAGKDEEKGDQDTQENRIFCNIHKRFSQAGIFLPRPAAAFQGQDQYREYIVERDGADDHQRCHTCAVIHIVNKGKSQDGGAAAVGSLDKGTLLRRVFHKEFRQAPDGEDDTKSHKKAKQHIASVKAAFNIVFCQVFKDQGGQGRHKNISVCGSGKGSVDDMKPVQHLPQYHQKKDR